MENSIKWLPDDYNEVLSKNFRRPFYTFLIKIASLCNLNCSYCYVYQTPDDSWKWKPKLLEKDIAQQIATRIQEHVSEHDLNDVTIVFHGGEPLLAGVGRLKELVQIISSTIRCKIHWGMQTNGTLLDKNIIEFLFENNFQIGISIDGTREHNDRHRVFHSGKSSYDETVKGIELIKSFPEWKKIFGGLLVVIDIRNKPSEILEAISELNVHSANPLLPDAHYESPPPHRKSEDDLVYGKWLYELFDVWYHKYPELEIPYFEEIITLLLGGISGAEEIGAKSVDLIVVDTNGDIEAVDTLKIVGRNATSLNLNVTQHSFDDALQHPAIYSRMSGFNTLCKQCRECEFLNNCGGGYIPHRYSKENGFINPSVYCNDLKYLFSKMKQEIFKQQT